MVDIYRFAEGNIRQRIAPTRRGFSVLGAAASFTGVGYQSAIIVMPWIGSSMDSVKKTGGYATGRVRPRILLKEGMSSWVSGANSTFAGNEGVEKRAEVGWLGAFWSLRSSAEEGTMAETPTDCDAGDAGISSSRMGGGTGAGFGWSAFITAAGFCSHAVIDDWSIGGGGVFSTAESIAGVLV
jgi:hypothetical protein